MSQFPTGTTTYSPASLTEQEKNTFRTEMGVAKTNGDITEDFEANNILARVVGSRVAGVGEAERYRIILKAFFDYVNPCKIIGYNNIPFIQQASGGDQVQFLTNGAITARTISTGDFVIVGSYSPFTGTHIATSKEELKVGELVSLHSLALDNKQPLWEANYCVASKKGVYGVVYDKFEDKYLIACVGDAVVSFSNENGPCEAGDYLVPSETKKGCVMVHKGDFVPLNQCGKAGEATNENKLIAWVKE